MANRRRRAKVVEEPVVEVEEVEEDEIEELEEEPVVRRSRRPANTPTKGRSRRKVVEPEEEDEELEDEEEEDEEEEDEEEEVPAPKPTRQRRSRKAAKPEPEEDEDEEELEEEPPAPKAKKGKVSRREAPVKTKRVNTVKEDVAARKEDKLGQIPASQFTDVLLELIEAGSAVTLRKVGGKIIIYNAGIVDELSTRPGVRRSLSGRTRAITKKEMYEVAYDPEFLKFLDKWGELSYEEKLAVAKKEKISWEEHETPRVNVMRLTFAYREAHEIPKWRPEYEDKAARDLLLYENVHAEPLDDEDAE